MELDNLKQQGIKLSAVADRMDARSEQAIRRVEHSAAVLDQSTQRLHAGVERFTHDALQALKARAGEVLGQGIDHAVKTCNAQLQDTATRAERTAQALDAQCRALERERRTWVWLGSTALVIGSVLAVGGTWYWVQESRREVARNRIEATLLRAYNQADVTLCDDGRLCANVDDKGERHGAKRQYRPVKAR